MLEVIVYDGENTHTFEDIDFVSIVNRDTFGPPPLIAPSKGEAPLAKADDRVLYINTNLVPMWEIVRVSDR